MVVIHVYSWHLKVSKGQGSQRIFLWPALKGHRGVKDRWFHAERLYDLVFFVLVVRRHLQIINKTRRTT